MSDIRHYVGPFTNNTAIRLFHNHRLDPATKGMHLIRLPDRTLVWSGEYEQRLREYERKPVAVFSDQMGTAPANEQATLFARISVRYTSPAFCPNAQYGK